MPAQNRNESRPTRGLVERLSFGMLLALAASIPVEDVAAFSAGRLSRLIGLGAFVAWAFAVLARGRLRPPAGVQLLAGAFLIWSIASYFWSFDSAATLSKSITLLQLVVLMWMVADQARTRFDLLHLMRAFLVGASVAAILAAVHTQSDSPALGPRRFATDNAGPNNAGAILAVAVMVALYLLAADSDRRWRWLYMLFPAVGGVSVILSGSRGALIAFGVGLAVIFVTRHNLRSSRLLLLAGMGALGFVLAAALVPQATLDRLGTTSQEIQEGTLDKRVVYWSAAYTVWGRHPVEGIGLGAFGAANKEISNRDAVAHNLYLSVAAETGVVGLSLFLLTAATACFGGGWCERAPLRRPWFAIWATWAVGAASLTWESRKVTWFLIAAGIVLASALRHENRLSTSAPVATDSAPGNRVTSAAER